MDRSSVPDHSNRLPSAERLLSIWENPAAKYEQSQSKGSKGGGKGANSAVAVKCLKPLSKVFWVSTKAPSVLPQSPKLML